ncbi:hypothetical protein TWF281_002416 [Arthrobotrys megalospora]
MKSLALLSLLALSSPAAAAQKSDDTKATCPAKYNPKCGFICGQKSIDFWYCSEKNIFPSPTDDNWCTECPGKPTEVKETCPTKYNPKCSFICGQKSIDFWYCSDKNIFPSPTDDNWCTPCPGKPKRSAVIKRGPTPVESSKPNDTCPAKYASKCGFICGQKSIDFWYCSEKNIFPEPTDDNWCTLCPGGPNVPGKYGPATIPSALPTAAPPASEVKKTCPAKFDTKCSFLCGQKSIDYWYCSEKNIFPNPTDDNGCTPCPEEEANSSTTSVEAAGASASETSSATLPPPPVSTGGAGSVKIGSLAAVGFVGLLMAF